MLPRSVVVTAGFYLVMIGISDSDPMKAPSFSDYALSPDLSGDGAVTVELLIDAIRSEHDDSYWDDFMERDEARGKPGYKPSFTKDEVALAASKLPGKDWVSLQRTEQRAPVKDLVALRYLPRLEGFAAGDNEIADLSPLKGLPEIRRLHLEKNRIEDLSPLAACNKLTELHVEDNPVVDFSPLAGLQSLRELSISWDQVPAFRKAGKLPSLKKLTLWFTPNSDNDPEPLSSLEVLPEMPTLRLLQGVKTRSLAGVHRFSSLRNLSMEIEGDDPSLAALSALGSLTHLHVTGEKIHDLRPLSNLSSLRSLWVLTEAKILSLEPLGTLFLLREVNVRSDGKEVPDLQAVRAKLPSWDTEFLVKEPRYTPSLELVSVDDKGFDAIDTKPPHGTVDPEGNADLLGSELEWLDRKLKPVFGRKLAPDEDYSLPFERWPVCRWRDVVLLTPEVDKDLSRIVSGMQRVLCLTRNDWILHLEAESGYKLWIYPNKIVVPKEHEATVKRLLAK